MNRVLYCMLLCTSSFSYAIFDTYRAHQLYQSGNIDAAKNMYAAMIVDNFQNWHALYNLGSIALQQKLYDEAVVHLEKTADVQPDNQKIRERLNLARKLRDEEKKKQEDEKRREDQKEQDHDQKKQEDQDTENTNQESKKKDSDNNQNQDQSENKRDTSDQQRQDQNAQQQPKQNQQPSKQEQPQDQQHQEQSDKSNAHNRSTHQNEKDSEQQKLAQQGAGKLRDERFSEQDAYLMQELDKIDQHVQKEMIRYAVSQNEPKDSTYKNW